MEWVTTDWHRVGVYCATVDRLWKRRPDVEAAVASCGLEALELRAGEEAFFRAEQDFVSGYLACTRTRDGGRCRAWADADRWPWPEPSPGTEGDK